MQVLQKIKKKKENNIIKDVINLFRLKKEMTLQLNIWQIFLGCTKKVKQSTIE